VILDEVLSSNSSLLIAFRELLPCTAGSITRTVDLLA
jgi:hypothetical protein